MTLPSFVGIGVPRAGTSWLHELLQAHPDIYMPSRRRELNFFDLYYDRGVSWYEKFFPPESDAGRYRAIGEITPYYFYGAVCPGRMARLPVEKLLLILRNPIDRAWSWYALMLRDGHFSGSFEAFLGQRRWPVIDQGTYSNYLREYLQYFTREQLLVLLFEEALNDIAGTKQRLADFLGVACDRFPEAAGAMVVNESYVPRAPRAYGLAVRVSRVLRKWDADWAVNAAKRLGVKERFGKAGRAQPMTAQTRDRLRRGFETELDTLERLLGVSLDVWR
jgi:sulfotransferase family protein